MNAGDCFHGDVAGGDNYHFWLVLCEPKNGRIALVNFTTGVGGAKSQKVTRGFFPTLEHDSELAWFDAVIEDDAVIEQGISDGIYESRVALPAKKLETLLMLARFQGLIPTEIERHLG